MAIGIGLALLLGVVQGVTEFLPISSSGHLRLMSAAFGIENAQTLFDVCVHAGTLAAVVAYYRERVIGMIRALFRPSWDNPDFRLGVFVVVGTIPAAVIGIGLGDQLEANLASVSTVGVFLILNGGILMLSKGAPAEGRGVHELTFRDAILIGCAQCVALLRGVSRSGSTIVAAMKLGISREAAATFSFLLSIPAIGGALVLEVGAAVRQGGVDAAPLLIGTASAAVSGYLALVLLVQLVKKGHLHRFAWYCFGLGGLVVLLTLV